MAVIYTENTWTERDTEASSTGWGNVDSSTPGIYPWEEAVLEDSIWGWLTVNTLKENIYDMKELRLKHDAAGVRLQIIVGESDTIHTGVLSTTATSVTPPTGAKFVLFSADDDFYASMTGTATVPSGAVTLDSTDTVLNPTVREISGVTTISLVSTGAPKITLAFYS